MVGNAKAYAKTDRTASVAIPCLRSLAAKPNSNSGSLGDLPTIRRGRFAYGDKARRVRRCGGFNQETVRAENAIHHLLKHGRKSVVKLASEELQGVAVSPPLCGFGLDTDPPLCVK
jgi:hypothetical protein